MGCARRDGQFALEAVETTTTLRDRLREIPVDAVVPDGWRVGVEVVKFGDELPADGATLSHPNYPRDLLLTSAGTDGDAIAVYERDRTTGRRVTVAQISGSATDGKTVTMAMEAAARQATRIESGSPGVPAVESGDSRLSLGGLIRGAVRLFRLD